MVPLALTVHCWLVWPLQSQISTFVPGAVWLLYASRHLPSTCSWLPLRVHRWLAPPLQSQMTGRVPLVVLLFGSSRHRFEPTPRIVVVVAPPPGSLVVPPATRYMTTPCPGTEELIVPLVVLAALVHRSVSA